MLFEQPFARVSPCGSRFPLFCASYNLSRQVPYENYRRIFRTSQKHVERDFGSIQNTANDVVSRGSSESLTQDEIVKSIDNMIGKVENLKRKVRICLLSTERYTTNFLSFQIYTKLPGNRPRML